MEVLGALSPQALPLGDSLELLMWLQRTPPLIVSARFYTRSVVSLDGFLRHWSRSTPYPASQVECGGPHGDLFGIPVRENEVVNPGFLVLAANGSYRVFYFDQRCTP